MVKQHKQIEKAIAELMAHPSLKKYGRPHKTSEPEHITDTESEFVVTYLKHTYADRVIFEFRVNNNMDDVLLENISINMDCEMEGLEEEGGIPIKDLKSGESKSAYVTFAKDPDSFLTGSAACVLCFTMKEVDKDTGEPEEDGTEDEYQLEEVTPRTPRVPCRKPTAVKHHISPRRCYKNQASCENHLLSTVHLRLLKRLASVPGGRVR